jgi:SAM-dependent methyltransferase
VLTPSRVAAAIERRIQILGHRGHAVSCPICGHSFDRFRDDWNRPGALCWRCGSHERHRAQWLLFERRAELLAGVGSLLHFAPEYALRHRLERLGGVRYVTADLLDPAVDLHLDLTRLDLPDQSFDAVVCSHVLEHVEDDRAAMRELHRITRRWCLVAVPLDIAREHTYEDPSIQTPEARQEAFWQQDHVRLYAPDIEQRLQAAGFDVERVEPEREFGPDALTRYGLLRADYLWLCRPQR